MKTSTIGSIVLAGILILATSVVSIVGTITPASTRTMQSPLFVHRTQQSNQGVPQQLHSNFLGKGQQLSLLFPSKSTFDELVDTAIRLICQNPQILNILSLSFKRMPELIKMLNLYNIKQADLDRFIFQMKNNPSLLRQQLEQAKNEIKSGEKPTHPLSLNTSRPIGCLLMGFAFGPVLVVLLASMLIVATISIVTCLNINDCLNNLSDKLSMFILQHLTQP